MLEPNIQETPNPMMRRDPRPEIKAHTWKVGCLKGERTRATSLVAHLPFLRAPGLEPGVVEKLTATQGVP